MTHLELSNLITDYADGQLDAGRAGQVEAHLADCAPCRAMVEDVRFAIASCGAVTDAEPAPWLLARIVRATTGQRERTLQERFVAWWRPMWRPQVAYSLSMAVFSLSFILYAANVSLRSMRLRDANPVEWAYRANRRGHMLVARAEKYYYDLRFVYELQSILRGLEQQPAAPPGTHEKMQAPGGSSGNESNTYGTQLTAARGAPAGHTFQIDRGARSQAL